MITTYLFVSISIVLSLVLAYTVLYISKLTKRLKLEQQTKITEKGTIDEANPSTKNLYTENTLPQNQA